MSSKWVSSFGVSKFWKWGGVNVRGIVIGILVFCYNKVLESVGMEVGEFSISCHLNIEASFREG